MNRNIRHFSATALAAALAGLASVADGAVQNKPSSPCAYRPQVTVPRAADCAVTVDGRADEPCWSSAGVITRLVSPRLFSPEGAQTRIRLLADDAALYVFCEFEVTAKSTRPKPPAARDKMVPTDIAEIFIKPTDENREYHFMIDGTGNLVDASCRFDTQDDIPAYARWKRNVEWNAEKLEWKTVYGEKCWTLEMKLPWSDIAADAPAPGRRMLMNFARGDYGAGGYDNCQLSEWALQKQPDFSDWRGWGVVAFADNPVRVTDAEIAKGNESVTVDLAGGAKASNVRVEVEEMDTLGNLRPIGASAEETLPAGGKKSVAVALREQTLVSWISVFADGRLLYRRGGRPLGTMLRIGLRDPMDKRGGRIFIPNDANWYTPFDITHTLTGARSNGFYGNPPELDARIVADLPEGVSVVKFKYSDWGWDKPQEKILSEKTVVEDGRTWHRFELPVRISRVERPLIFFRSTLPAGTEGVYRLYMTWKDGRQKPVERPFRVVSYGRVKPFERMQMRMDDMMFNLADTISGDRPMVTELPSLGVNVFRIPLTPSRERQSYGKESYAQRLKRFMREADASGVAWHFMNQNDLNALNCWSNEKSSPNPFGQKMDLAARFKDRKGEDVRGQFYMYTVCPNYRGTNFTLYVEGIRKSEAVKDYGVTWLVLDFEIWGPEPCYCDRCRALFRDFWCGTRGLPDYGDPRQFMADEKAHADAVREWRDFYAWSKARLYGDVKAGLNARLDPTRTLWRAPKKGTFVISEWISPRKHSIASIDYHDWPFAYRPPWAANGCDRAADNVLRSVTHGSAKQIVCSLNAMQGCEFNQEFPPVGTWQNMLEAAALGCQGFEWYYAPDFDAETWKYVMDGLRTIRPFEDIVLDGATSVTAREADCTWRRIALCDEALYCVRNYHLAKPVEASFTVDALPTGEVRDAVTGEKLADLRETGATTVRLALSPENPVRLLYAGSRFDKRRDAVKVADPNVKK